MDHTFAHAGGAGETLVRVDTASVAEGAAMKGHLYLNRAAAAADATRGEGGQ
jgi:hypothetical protein